MVTATRNGIALGYEKLTGLAAAKALQAIPSAATYAVVTVGDQPIRWREDGTDPTADLGTPVYPLQQFVCDNLSALRVIEQAASARCDIAYYK